MNEFAEFREFIIWLCGYTDAQEAPDEKSWGRLQKKVHEVAAKFALYKRDQDKLNTGLYGYQEALLRRTQQDMLSTAAQNIAVSDSTSNISCLASRK